MKRAIIRVPTGTRYETLTEQQQAAIDSVFAQFVLPMPGTQSADGHELVDGLAGDNFDPSVMPGLGMDWPVVGLWQWAGRGPLTTLQPLDEAALLAHLPPVVTLDDEGEVFATAPPTLHEPHRWAGWPAVL